MTRLRLPALLTGVCITLLSAQSIQQLEYFIDTDPGYGLATQVAITPGDPIDKLFTVDITGYGNGFHALFVRVRDDSGYWSLANSRPFYLETADQYANRNVVAAEYFIDDDLGYGLGTPISITPDSSINQLFSIDLSGLSSGFHALFVRVRNAAGYWSMAGSRPFFLENVDLTADRNITAVEYFIDSDPGYGRAIPVAFIPDNSMDQLFAVDLDTLTSGFHAIFVRVRDAAGYWSMAGSRPFFLENVDITVDRHITAAEYFIDDDPGYGLATAISITPDSSVNQLFTVDLDTLESGFHALFVRVRDAAGAWSLANSRPFYLEASDLAQDRSIVAAEYFVDLDPGYGQATPIAITPDSSINQLYIVDLDTMATGFHTFHTRAQDASGQWSLSSAKPFYLSDKMVRAAPEIEALNYQFTNSSGPVTALTPVPGWLPADNVTADFTADLSGLEEDSTYQLLLVARDELGRTSFQSSHTVLVAYGPYISVQADSLVFGYLEAGNRDSLSITIHSIGDSTLTITSFNPPDGFSTNPAAVDIAADDSAVVWVIFAPSLSQDYSASLTITSNALNFPSRPILLRGTGHNWAPVATADTVETGEDLAVSINVLANDLDLDQNRLNIYSFTAPLHGTAEQVGDSTITYLPDSNYFGWDSLRYVVTDGNQAYDTAALHIHILPANDPPGEFRMHTINRDSTILITVDMLPDSLHFSWSPAIDPEGDAVSYLLDWGAGLNLPEVAPLADTAFSFGFDSIAVWLYQRGLTYISDTWNLAATDQTDTSWVLDGPFELTLDISTLEVTDILGLPTEFALHQNYPNPFNPNTSLRYELPLATDVVLVVYDILGREVIRLVDDHKEAGYHQVIWNGQDQLGRSLSSGVYIYRLVTSQYSHAQKMLLLK